MRELNVQLNIYLSGLASDAIKKRIKRSQILNNIHFDNNCKKKKRDRLIEILNKRSEFTVTYLLIEELLLKRATLKTNYKMADAEAANSNHRTVKYICITRNVTVGSQKGTNLWDKGIRGI